MSAKKKNKRASASRIASRVARIALACVLALAVTAGCGYLVWYLYTQLSLPARAQTLIVLACAACVLASALLLRAYIRMVASEVETSGTKGD